MVFFKLMQKNNDLFTKPHKTKGKYIFFIFYFLNLNTSAWLRKLKRSKRNYESHCYAFKLNNWKKSFHSCSIFSPNKRKNNLPRMQRFHHISHIFSTIKRIIKKALTIIRPLQPRQLKRSLHSSPPIFSSNIIYHLSIMALPFLTFFSATKMNINKTLSIIKRCIR